MNFKFRSSMNNQRPHHSHPNPNPTYISYFTQQAMRAGLSTPPTPRYDHPTTSRYRDIEFDLDYNNNYNNPLDIPGSIQREMEKERIRAEILAEEMLRRRVLEEEVRREIMMEREFFLRRGGVGGVMQGGVPLLTDFAHNPVGGVGVSSHREVGFGRRGGGGFEARPFQRDPVLAGIGNGSGNVNGNGSGSRSGVGLETGSSKDVGFRLQEIKEGGESNDSKAPPAEVSKDKVIILAKPITNVADLKRKALTPQAGDAVEVFKKSKTKEDWSCALCHITATCEQGLNEHLQGKKHKARERGMVSQRMGFGTHPLPKMSSTKTGKPFNVLGSLSFRTEKQAYGNLLMTVDDGTIKKPRRVDNNNSNPKEKETPVEKKETGKTKMAGTAKPKKNFRFFCEMCKVGAYSLTVFKTHERGKRHATKLLEVKKTDEIAVGTQNGAIEENKVAESAAKEVKENKEVELAAEEVKENKEADLAAEEVKEVAKGEFEEKHKGRVADDVTAV